MQTFFRALLRCISLSLAFTLATFSAAAFLTLVLYLDGNTTWQDEGPLFAATTALFFVFMWFTIAWLSFIPACFIILIYEFSKIRSALSNILAGGVVALSAGFLPRPGIQPEWEELPYSSQHILISVLAAGFISGFIFWAFAGNRAGNWLPRSNANSKFDP